jgi:hypothetical protein
VRAQELPEWRRVGRLDDRRGTPWSIAGRTVTALLTPDPGARRYMLIASRAQAKTTSVVCTLTGAGTLRFARCTIARSAGTSNLAAEAPSNTALIAQAAHVARVG